MDESLPMTSAEKFVSDTDILLKMADGSVVRYRAAEFQKYKM
jgi:hypothetical protein